MKALASLNVPRTGVIVGSALSTLLLSQLKEALQAIQIQVVETSLEDAQLLLGQQHPGFDVLDFESFNQEHVFIRKVPKLAVSGSNNFHKCNMPTSGKQHKLASIGRDNVMSRFSRGRR